MSFEPFSTNQPALFSGMESEGRGAPSPVEPCDASLLIDQGKILAKMGRDREAISNFSHALDVDDKAVAAFRERGLVYKKLGDIAAALADLTWFTRFEPRDTEVVRAIEEMQAADLSPTQAEPEPSRPPETKKAELENSKPSEGQRADRPGPAFSFLRTAT